jgi:hypothetical protein
MCHNDCKLTDELANLKLDRVTDLPTLFARPDFVRFLAIWNVEAENQGSGVLDS